MLLKKETLQDSRLVVGLKMYCKVTAQSPCGEFRRAQLNFRRVQVSAPTGLGNVFYKSRRTTEIFSLK